MRTLRLEWNGGVAGVESSPLVGKHAGRGDGAKQDSPGVAGVCRSSLPTAYMPLGRTSTRPNAPDDPSAQGTLRPFHHDLACSTVLSTSRRPVGGSPLSPVGAVAVNFCSSVGWRLRPRHAKQKEELYTNPVVQWRELRPLPPSAAAVAGRNGQEVVVSGWLGSWLVGSGKRGSHLNRATRLVRWETVTARTT